MSGHISPKTTYYTIFGALIVCTALTVGAAFVNLGDLNFPVALTIAIFKATLVILFFMHVKYSSRMTKLIVGVAFFFLGIMLTLTLSDYLSRGWFTAPGAIISLSSPPQPVPPVEPVPPAEPGQNTSPK